MAHFAKIVDGTVTQVVVVDNSEEHRGEEFLNSIGLTGVWVQTSYNGNFGGKFAAIGDTYVASTKTFKQPKAPKQFVWNEELSDWVEN